MKSELEPQDVEDIAQRVSDILRPMLARIERGEVATGSEVILDVKGLAEYLHVTPPWVYKQVSLKTIPYFKTGKYPRFRKKDIDKWIESQTARPIPPLKLVKNRGVTS